MMMSNLKRNKKTEKKQVRMKRKKRKIRRRSQSLAITTRNLSPQLDSGKTS
jgi:hypothetical protein